MALRPKNPGQPVAVDDDGTEVVSSASRLNFGTDLSVTDDGSGEVTVNSTASGGGGGSALLDWHQVARASNGSTSLGTGSYVTVAENSVTLEVSPTVPSNGELRIVFYLSMGVSAAWAARLHDGTSVIAGTYRRGGPSGSAPDNTTMVWYLTGLTASSTQTVQVQAIGVGGARSLYSGPSDADGDWGPLTLEAWSTG